MKILFLAIAILTIGLLGSCATTHLNYPVDKVEVPTKVTVYVGMIGSPSIDNQKNLLTKDLWNLTRKDAMTDMLGRYDPNSFRTSLLNRVVAEMKKPNKIFSFASDGPQDLDISYARRGDDPAGYSGYNFQYLADQIPTKYVLTFYITDWGYRATNDVRTEGPYVNLNCQLVDKETNQSLWEYNDFYLSSYIKAPNDDVQSNIVYDMLKEASSQVVGDVFSYLR